MTDPVDVDTVVSAQRATGITTSSLNSLAQTRWRTWLGKVSLFIISLFLFILAIMLMKDGSRGLAPLMRNLFNINNAANSLGFGWLFAYIIMSGSPVAAAALTFLDAGALNKLDAFAMIIGSRLGASFLVLFIGFMYVLRGRNRSTSLGMGLLSLLVTISTYLFSFLIGAAMLQADLLDSLQLNTGVLLSSIIDIIFTPFVRFFTAWLPDWGLFPVGMVIIIMSFNLFDRCLPQMSVKKSQVGQISRLVYRPWVMFILGALITLMSMSVSVSLSILVPLSDRGFIRRENVIPYIMGANITTFIDTMLAAVLLATPYAFTIILTSMVSITLVSVIILLTIYHTYERLMLNIVNWVIQRNRNLAIFMGTIFLIPLLLLVL